MMEKSKVEVFTSPTCPHCPSAKNLAKQVEKEREDIEVKELSTATDEGMKKAQHYGIMSVPTLLINGPAYSEPIGMRGTPSKQGLNKAVNISLGLEEWKEEKGLFEKLKGLFR